MSTKTRQNRTPMLELARLQKPVRRPRATEAEAKTLDREVIRLVADKSGWLRLGLLVQKVSESHAFMALGFPTMYAG